MNRNRKTEIKVGITVAIGIILFLWIFGWAKNYRINSDRKIIKIEFNSVAGLEKGDAVTINGVRKGYVDDIRNADNSVIVTVNLDNDVKIKEDATFSILMLDLMGGKKIEINPGNSNNGLDYGKLQKGIFLGDISTAMAMLSSVQNDLVDVIKEVKISLTNLNSVFSKKEFFQNIESSVKNLSELSKELSLLINKQKSEIEKLIENGNKMADNFNTVITENRENIKTTLKSSSEALTELKKLIEKANKLSDETVAQKNNLGKILYDENIVNDLKSSLNKLNKLSEILIKQLQNEGINVDANIF